MSWLKVNGIELARLVAAGMPDGKRRDIGDQGEAADGTTRVTRQTRKRDLNFETVPLGRADALAWEGLLMGEGNVWSFDASLYSSKGIPILDGGVAAVQATFKKYGAKALQVTAGEAVNSSGLQLGSVWTVSVWAAKEDGVFQHYVVRSDGLVWTGGALGDGDAFNSNAAVAVFSGELQLSASFSMPWIYFDDVVVCPYLWPLNWAAQVFVAGAPFGPAPFLICAGDVISEAATRTMIGKESDEKIMIAAGDRDRRKLTFSLVEV